MWYHFGIHILDCQMNALGDLKIERYSAVLRVFDIELKVEVVRSSPQGKHVHLERC
jgi:hypothetical protein